MPGHAPESCRGYQLENEGPCRLLRCARTICALLDWSRRLAGEELAASLAFTPERDRYRVMQPSGRNKQPDPPPSTHTVLEIYLPAFKLPAPLRRTVRRLAQSSSLQT